MNVFKKIFIALGLIDPEPELEIKPIVKSIVPPTPPRKLQTAVQKPKRDVTTRRIAPSTPIRRSEPAKKKETYHSDTPSSASSSSSFDFGSFSGGSSDFGGGGGDFGGGGASGSD